MKYSYKDVVYIIVTLLIIGNLIYSFLKSNSLKSSLSKFLIWFAIVFVIITGYAFKPELDIFKHRVLAVLIPSYSWINKHEQLIISRNQDGHFYIDALVNNIKIKFLIDTGATSLVLSKEDASMLNIDLSKLDFHLIYHTANGSNVAAPVIIRTLFIGNKTFNDVKAIIGKGELDISLLGMSFLKRFKSFSIDDDNLILSY